MQGMNESTNWKTEINRITVVGKSQKRRREKRKEKGRERRKDKRLRDEETKPDGEANGARAGGAKPDEEVDLLWSQLQYAYFTGTSTCSCKEISLFY